MLPAAALTHIETVAHVHRGGHRCTDGKWYNDNAGPRIECGTVRSLRDAADQVRALHASVHQAAHDPAAVDAVVAAMTSTPVEDMLPLVRESWTMMARLAIEGLAAHLDVDDSPEARRAEAAAAMIRERASDLMGTLPDDHQ